MSDVKILEALLDAVTKIPTGELLLLVLLFGAVLGIIRGQGVFSVFIGNGYLKRGEYQADMSRVEGKLDAVAEDLNVVRGKVEVIEQYRAK